MVSKQTKGPQMSDNTFYAYSIVTDENGITPRFKRVGTAYENRDGSINLQLDKLPIGGRVHLSRHLRESGAVASDDSSTWHMGDQK
jgi:hypothetical protein